MTCYLQDYQRKVFPMPIWKASSLQKKEGLWISFSRLLQPPLGKTQNQRGAQRGSGGAQPSQMPPVGLISPASSTQITPGSQTSLHVSGGENRNAVLQRDKSSTAVTHPHILRCPFPSCFKLIYFCQHWPILKKRGQVSLFKEAFPKRGNQSFPERADVQRHIKYK